MNCPNCGKPYQDTDSICPFCNSPLGNAAYVAVKKKPKRKRIVLLIVLLVLLLLTGIGYFSYQYYIKTVERECLKVTEQIMACAKKMNFSEFPKEQLPEELAEEPNIKKQLKTKTDQMIKDYGLSDLFSILGIEIDYENLPDMILSQAEYEIKDVSATYNTCTVTVETSNINYPNIIYNMEEELNSIIKDAAPTSIGWWMSIKEWLSSLFLPEEEYSELPKSFTQWLKNLSEDQEIHTLSGNIVYGIKDGHWTLLSIDKELFYNYYGFSTINEGE